MAEELDLNDDRLLLWLETRMWLAEPQDLIDGTSAIGDFDPDRIIVVERRRPVHTQASLNRGKLDELRHLNGAVVYFLGVPSPKEQAVDFIVEESWGVRLLCVADVLVWRGEEQLFRKLQPTLLAHPDPFVRGYARRHFRKVPPLEPNPAFRPVDVNPHVVRLMEHGRFRSGDPTTLPKSQ